MNGGDRAPDLIDTGRANLFGNAWEIVEDNGDSTFDLRLCHDSSNLMPSAIIESVKALGGGLGYEAGTRGVLCVLSDGTLRFMPTGTPVQDDSPDVEIGTTAETEAAQTDSWAIGDGTLKYTVMTRPAYAHAGDQKLYAYFRDEYYSADGRLTKVSAETCVTVDIPDACP